MALVGIAGLDPCPIAPFFLCESCTAYTEIAYDSIENMNSKSCPSGNSSIVLLGSPADFPSLPTNQPTKSPDSLTMPGLLAPEPGGGPHQSGKGSVWGGTVPLACRQCLLTASRRHVAHSDHARPSHYAYTPLLIAALTRGISRPAVTEHTVPQRASRAKKHDFPHRCLQFRKCLQCIDSRAVSASD